MIANMNKTNGVKIFALVAVLAMVVAGTAVIMSDNGVDAASSKDPTYLSGSITATQNYGDGTEVVVTDDLVIPTGMAMIVSGTGKLTVNEGATITIQAGGQLIFQQTDGNNPTVKINGDIVAEGTMPQNYTTLSTSSSEESAKPQNAQYYGAIVNNTTNDGKTGVFLNGSITLEEGAELIMTDTPSDALTQTPGTNVIAITGITALNDTNGDIVLSKGASINVTKKSSDISIIADQDVMLNEGAIFEVNGKINDVTISSIGTGTYYTTGAVTVNKTANNYDNPDFAKDASDLTFTVINQTVSAYTVPNDSDSRISLKQFIVNIEGTLAVNDSISIEAGISIAKNASASFYTTDKVEISNNKIIGMSSVSGTMNVDIGSDVTIADGAYLDVSGTVDISYDDEVPENNGIVTIQGTLAVSGAVNGYALKDGSTLAASGNYKIIVNNGTIALKTDASDIMGLYNALGLEPKVYGTVYMVDGETSKDFGTVYITDFDVAIANATAAEVEDVYVLAYGAHMRTTADYAINNGAPVVDTNIVIPDGMTVTIVNALVVSENGTITVEDGGEIAFQTRTNTAKLWVEGKIIDYDGVMAEFESDVDKFIYEVKKTTETDTEEYVTYTTLKIALSEAQSGETIDLHGQIVIDENMTIPEQVTVITDVDDGDAAITIVGATLTVNGTLEIKDGASVDLESNADTKAKADIVVNNIVANASASTFTYTDDATYVVDGAYFTGTIGDYEAVQFITSSEVAAENSASATTDITINGTVSMGDVAFTEGEENDDLNLIIAQGAVVTAGTVTLNGADISIVGTFTGTVNAPVTTGNTTLTFVKAYGLNIDIISEDDGETITTTVELNGNSIVDGKNRAKLFGEVALTVGTAALNSSLVVNDLTVAQDATLYVNESATLYVNGDDIIQSALTASKFPYEFQSIIEDEAALTVDGTVTVKGAITWGPIVINGTLSTEENSKMQVDVILINGTLSVADGTQVIDSTENVSAALVNGTLNGNIKALGVFAYPGSDVSSMKMNVSGSESTAVSTEFYVNGDLQVTVYMDKTNKTYNISQMLAFIDVEGVRYNTATYYLDEAMTDKIDDDEVSTTYVGAVKSVYIGMEPSIVSGTITVYDGMSLYIDGQSISSFWNSSTNSYELSVGTHTFVVQVSPGLSGTPEVTFDGQTVTESFTINNDAKGFQIIVSGDITQDSVIIDGGNGGSDSLGLTDYLLIILVILIVIMAIMVALRLMRS